MTRLRIQVLSAACVLALVGCDGGRVGRAIRGIQELAPEVQKRDQQVNELIDPAADQKTTATP
jgi:hypothetical protein